VIRSHDFSHGHVTCFWGAGKNDYVIGSHDFFPTVM